VPLRKDTLSLAGCAHRPKTTDFGTAIVFRPHYAESVAYTQAAKRDSGIPSHSEIASDKRISQHLFEKREI
jgi:hypothetical protein